MLSALITGVLFFNTVYIWLIGWLIILRLYARVCDHATFICRSRRGPDDVIRILESLQLRIASNIWWTVFCCYDFWSCHPRHNSPQPLFRNVLLELVDSCWCDEESLFLWMSLVTLGRSLVRCLLARTCIVDDSIRLLLVLWCLILVYNSYDCVVDWLFFNYRDSHMITQLLFFSARTAAASVLLGWSSLLAAICLTISCLHGSSCFVAIAAFWFFSFASCVSVCHDCLSCSCWFECLWFVLCSSVYVSKVFGRPSKLPVTQRWCQTNRCVCWCWIDQQDRRQATTLDPTRKCTCFGMFIPCHDLICHEPRGATTHQPESPAESRERVICAGGVSVDHVYIIVAFYWQDNFYFKSLV